MIVTGEIENVPLLDVFQVLAYSHQTGALFVRSDETTRTVVFDEGGVVCAESPATRLLLERAAQEVDPQRRRTLRRAQTLACLAELMSLRTGVFQFKKLEEPLGELSGIDVSSFYASGAMSTADLLLVLATAVDKKDKKDPVPASAPKDDKEGKGARAYPRYSPTLIEAGQSNLSGHLTNLSAGGAFFQGDALPERDTVSELRFDLPGGLGAVTTKARVVWARTEAIDGERGVGLAFEEISSQSKEKLRAYIERFQQLAADILEKERQMIQILREIKAKLEEALA